MPDKVWDLLLIFIAAVVSKIVEVGWEILKEKVSERRGKHFKRP